MRDNQFFLPRSLAMEMTAILTPAEEGGYVALNPETGTTTQGETVEEAIANLTERTYCARLETGTVFCLLSVAGI